MTNKENQIRIPGSSNKKNISRNAFGKLAYIVKHNFTNISLCIRDDETKKSDKKLETTQRAIGIYMLKINITNRRN